ncbi:PREDICTED: omega-hydroxypalmitate O-feruloyl transferase-like [Tarenaya hassleriana]|uniref:omega-hydroxypalmitate O-feruloyl transferase-like n=1 Tax=Tarenaya hassleriana TaxID=28532 RepID=UPI00053C1FE6|nr:PREDICTED: omega-hydroxypalmitate O-feruloyl transferase-like [Tarenaya hassleriana]
MFNSNNYYAFAGEITTNSLGEPELLCNNYGVEFSEARAYVNLHDLDLLEKSIYRLFPEKKRGVMVVQATELNYGSLIVTCRVDHRIADAYSANLFFVSWAESARSMPISIVPSFRRSLLSSRHPPKHSPSMDELYMPLPSVSSPPKPKRNPDSDSDLDEFVSRVFYIEASKIDEIQCLASSEYSRVTKLEAFCAFLWKLTAKTKQKSGGARKAALGIVIDGRTRLGDNGVNNMGS